MALIRVLALLAALLASATAGEAQAQSAISIEGGETTITEGTCSVRWYGDPRFGPWLYELSPECFPKASSPLVEAAVPVVGGSSLGPPVRTLVTWFYCRYDGGYRGDGGNYCGVMASGKRVYDGAAACGYVWPLGTVLEIEGYGRVVCEDRGSAVRGHHIDIFMWTSSQGTACGCQYVYRTVREVLR